ncbi:Leucine-rich repeat cysteine-containing subtype [Penicillium atrosanguineum]|uniref:Leucine-rich repeat cysteine-containing subtype n=1 Tax=Penicillium atrosanguineum TaxID=1132637 RepID=A0A9W9GZL6_9EURO|nr:Pyruvate kinase [Penicillium atrosanguineum]KAJ5132159.1 Leucine-rich repeat cysteine-containing subtype [Penicillium atrosanguineum]KAJ5137631.1 Leucine-rich repeat cysteine-containing subtype [Penicillium atrosanguineum]KAJ5289825.1 Pyruvate kinase [Penicillium atrosanguineum]KAJ5307647.1 Leucine-rich repeat cysteine-containing subtype [Penicillium atrosanguineum]
MATPITDEIVPSPEISPTSPASSTGQIPLDQPPKLKGRRKLLQSLGRRQSSQSLTRRGRSASTGYRRDNKASLSCVSLSSTYSPCVGNGSPAQLYGGLNPRPATPGWSGAPDEAREINNRIRLMGTESPASLPRTVPLPLDMRPASRGSPLSIAADADDTASADLVTEVDTELTLPDTQPAKTLDFWEDMPRELKMEIFRYLNPREIVRCAGVSKMWNDMCFDGQLWAKVDTTEYYNKIPSDVLVKLITSGGAFVRDLNLRGCIQLRDKWSLDGERISDLCRNVVNFSLEGCLIDKTSIHYFLLRNPRLEYINVSALSSVTNSAMKIIAQSCPQLETLNISWCSNVTAHGLLKVVNSCPRLKDLRASEIRGFANEDFTLALYEKNTLERLIMSRTDLSDASLKALMHGIDPPLDVLTDRPIVPPRRLRHLDVHHCPDISDDGLKSLAGNVPDLEGLQVSQCSELTDESIIEVIRTTPYLSHLEIEDLESLTNNVLTEIAKSPCAQTLEHLNISYCENLGDTGMLQVIKSCPKLQSVEMDNTRVSDLSLMEASYRVRKRGYSADVPKFGLRLVVFDCANVTWAGVKEVLSSNCFIPRSRKPASTIVTVTQTSDADSPTTTTYVTPVSTPSPSPTYPNQIIQLKCFYGWQMTVDEHTKRVLRGDLASASRLDRKWADYMMANEEAGAGGAGARRRRRRAREAERLYNADDDEDDDTYGAGTFSALGGRRRRAQSGCVVM